MASLYTQAKSPYWWVKYRDPATGKLVRKSTMLRWNSRRESSQAEVMRAQLALAEAQAGGVREDELWRNWVTQWIALKHSESHMTRALYVRSWELVEGYLLGKGVTCPRQVAYSHVAGYVAWRVGNGVKKSSALVEVRVWATIMAEAVRRGYASSNPCHRHGMRAAPPKIKPEITDAERLTIEKALGGMPQWMQVSWAIAIHQGCRFAETCLPLDDVDLQKRTITFTIKGRRRHTTALHPELVPLFKKLKAKGQKMTFDPSVLGHLDQRGSASSQWLSFFKGLGLGHLCFHCTRVTVITQLARAGVNEQTAKRFVGHSSSLVHQVYTRLQAGDLQAAIDAIRPHKPSDADAGD